MIQDPGAVKVKQTHLYNIKMKTVSGFAPSSLRQKQFAAPKPVREYHRFIPEQYANTGINPSSNLKEFMQKDIIHPLERDRTSLYQRTSYDLPSRQNKWSLNYGVVCPTEANVPKFQQYKEYYFPKRTSESVEKYKNTYLSTDNVAIKIPKFDTKKKEDFLNMKQQYNFNTESGSSWGPRSYSKSVNNHSSVNYDIITFKGGEGSCDNTANILEKKLINKKKAVGEFNDLTKAFSVNLNKKYEGAYKDNKKTFYHFNGIFTHLYDSSFRNGNIIMPFRKKKENTKEAWGYSKK